MPNTVHYRVVMRLDALPEPSNGSRAFNWYKRRFPAALEYHWANDLTDIEAVDIDDDDGDDLANKLNKIVADDCTEMLRIDFDLGPYEIPNVATFNPNVWQYTTGGHEGEAYVTLYGGGEWKKVIDGVLTKMQISAQITS